MKKNLSNILQWAGIIGIAVIATALIIWIILLLTPKPHVESEREAIDDHIYKWVDYNGHKHLMDDIENCPKCQELIIHLADSVAKSRYY